MRFISRLTAALTAAAMLAGFCSCGGKKKEGEEHHHHNLVEDNMGDDVNVSQDDLPFGALESILGTDAVPIEICYDTRYITEDEAAKISKYFSALNNKDTELFNSVVYEPYLSKLIENADCTSVDDYIATQYTTLTQQLGDGFGFDYIDFEEALLQGQYDFTDFDTVILNNDPTVQITDRKLLTAVVEYKNNVDGDSHVKNINVCLYTINGQSYIVR